jgi:hypothetical protein
MSKINILAREASQLINSVKDTTISNVVRSVNENMVQINEDQLANIINIIALSIEEGYQKALPSFQRTLQNNLKE